MASQVIDELAIVLGLDASQLDAALAKTGEKLQQMGEGAEQILGELADSLFQTGTASEESANRISKAYQPLGKVFDSVRSHVLRLVSALGATLAGAMAFNSYLEDADGLGQLSRKTGIAVEELDAWGKANEAAGGSAKALQGTLENFYKRTGRPATEFFKLGEKIAGMSELQAQKFLQAQGVALDAVPVFLKGQRAAEELVAKYRQTAFTAQDAKLAREYKNAWADFRTAAQDVAAVFIRAVMPALTWVGRMLERGARLVRENIEFVKAFGVVLGVVFGARLLANIGAAVTAVKLFGAQLWASLAPVLAIGAAVAAIALALEDLWGFAEGKDSLIERMMRSFGIGQDAIEALRASIGAMFDSLKQAWREIQSALSTIAGGLLKAIAGVLIVISGLITGLVAGIAGIVTNIDDWAKALYDLMPSFSDIGAFFAQVGDWAKGAAETIRSAFLGAFDAVKDVLDTISNGLSGAWERTKNFFGFGGNEPPPPATATPSQQAVLADQARAGGSTVNTTTTMNQTLNVTTRDDPRAIAEAAGRAASGASARMNRQAMQIGSGVRLK